MFDECCHNDMRSWFEKHIQRMEDDLRSRNLSHLVKVDPQRRRRVFEEIFMSSSPRSQSPQDDVKVLCELATGADKFTPEDIEVTLKGREMTVHARKEVKFENGFSLREVKKSFKIAEGFDLEKLSAHLTESKITIKAPMIKVAPEKRTGNIEIKVKRIVDDDVLQSNTADVHKTQEIKGDNKTTTQIRDAEVEETTNIEVNQKDSQNIQTYNDTDKRNADLSKHLDHNESYESQNFEVTRKDDNEYVLKRRIEMKSCSETESKNIEF